MDPLADAREQALRLLGVRARSRRELAERLRAKGHAAERVEALLDRLTEAGLVDDARFAAERARSLLRRKGFGPRKLRADLTRLGVAAELVEAAIEAAYAQEPPEALMRREVCRRFGEQILSPEAEPRLRQRAVRFLLGRGFAPDAVRELLEGRDY